MVGLSLRYGRMSALIFCAALVSYATLFSSSALARNLALTQSLGAFITPIDATASSAQEGSGRVARKLIDGSGWGETLPGSGVYVHTSNVGSDGTCMWNGAFDATLGFDLGRTYNVRGVYVWNYNEGGGWNTRSVKEVEISASVDNRSFLPVGKFTLKQAPGKDDDPGEAIAFAKVVRARWFRWKILSNYRGGEMSGLAEVRFANADLKAVVTPPTVWKPTYPRPTHPRLALGQPLPGAENIAFPAASGVVDVTQAPYRAKGDGKTDDTHALQQALDDNTDRGAILYFPNGIYRVSDTLRWGGDESRQRNTTFWGQSRAGAVLQLRDHCVGFQNPRKPKGVLYTGHQPAQRFGNELHMLTIDTGVGNPGADGIQFIANNQGGVYDVTIVSGDGQGVNGLDLGYTNEQGPCLIKNVQVQGFDVGVSVSSSVDSETLEHIVLKYQNKYGFRNDGQPCTVRDLYSINAVPAFRAGGVLTTLVDCRFEGVKGAGNRDALEVEGPTFCRNLKTSGYRAAIRSRVGGNSRVITGPDVSLYLSKPVASLFGSAAGSLNLPVKETPEVVWDTPKTWVGVQQHGATPDNEADASDALQKAIDSGATTVYLPRGAYRIGKTVVLRGNVRRLIGCKAYLIPIAPLTGQNAPLFRFADGMAPVVVVEGINTDFSGGPYFFLEHASKRTLVLRRLAINFQAAEAYRTGPGGTGDIFIEDVVGRFFHFHRQHLWARQFNPEGDGIHVENDGGTAWILGLKTEGGGPLLLAKNGSTTELLGGFSYSIGDTRRAPMFVIENARVALSFAEVCYTGEPFPIIVHETRGGSVREIKQDDPLWRGSFPLFHSGGAE